MTKHLFWLSDAAWTAIDAHLPHERPGKPRVDDRRVISGILHVLKTSCRRRDLPAGYGPPTTIYNRFNRWSRREAALRPFPPGDRFAIIWQRVFEAVAATGEVPPELSLDSTHVKAHRSAAGAKRGSGNRRSAGRAAAAPRRSMAWPTMVADRSGSA